MQRVRKYGVVSAAISNALGVLEEQFPEVSPDVLACAFAGAAISRMCNELGDARAHDAIRALLARLEPVH